MSTTQVKTVSQNAAPAAAKGAPSSTAVKAKQTPTPRKPSALSIAVAVGLGLAAVALAALGLWWLLTHRVVTKTGSRLYGTNLTGTTGMASTSSKGCLEACKKVKDATGYAQWNNGNMCWCVGEPYQDPMYVDDSQWTSGVFKRNIFKKSTSK